MMEAEAVFRVLGDGTRLKIYETLIRTPQPVSALSHLTGLSLAATLQHVQLMERGGLIVTDKQGRTRVCRMRGEPLRAVEGWISERRKDWNQAVDRLAAEVEGRG